MARFAVFLRGVNVGRGNRVPMAELRALLEALDYGGVRTLLNSGNAVFDSVGGSPQTHAARIRKELAGRLGVDVPVIVKSAKSLAEIEAENPLANMATDPSRLLIALTSDPKMLQALAPIASRVSAPEHVHIGRHAAYLWCPAGILESKAAQALLGPLGKATTTRNWATILKINALLDKETA
jgi:uncharacterized protein (DUF1697 family)